ncbi:SIMPL domain-containing protein [Parasphingorhabdus sp.]
MNAGLAFFGSLALISSASAADVQIVAQNPVVELSVTETVETVPDTAAFSTGVETKAATATQALRENSRQTRILIDKLKSAGIAEKDIQTTGISLNADYEYDRENKGNRFVGYRVSNQVRAKVRKLNKLGSILDMLVSEGGATNLNGPYFSVSNDAPLKKLARERALSNARAQAEEYARASGYGGVKVLSVSEVLRSVSPAQMPVMRSMASAAAESVPVSVGQVGTGVTLNISYEMIP